MLRCVPFLHSCIERGAKLAHSGCAGLGEQIPKGFVTPGKAGQFFLRQKVGDVQPGHAFRVCVCRRDGSLIPHLHMVAFGKVGKCKFRVACDFNPAADGNERAVHKALN